MQCQGEKRRISTLQNDYGDVGQQTCKNLFFVVNASKLTVMLLLYRLH